MGVTNPDADTYRRQSMVIVPMDTPGVTIERDVPVFGFNERSGHPVIHFDNVRIPTSNLLGDEGSGFAIAQARLGPGRIHHCMRAIGMAERAFDMMCSRAKARETFGQPVSEHGVVQDWIAEARIQIEQARLLVLKTAWLIDTVGVKSARIEISAIKVLAPRVAAWVLDRAIQVFGAAGVTDDFPLAALYAHVRTLQIADGPDEVHKRSLARRELRRYEPGFVPPLYEDA
jgi:acyl-CoA dehydrogenase